MASMQLFQLLVLSSMSNPPLLLFLLLCIIVNGCRTIEHIEYEQNLAQPEQCHSLAFDSAWDQVPGSIEQFTALQSVDVSIPGLRRLPDGLYDLPMLKTLRITMAENLDVRHLMEGVSRSSSITHVILDNVVLDSLPVTSPLHSVQVFYLPDAGLKSTGRIGDVLPNLEVLVVSGNPEIVFDSTIRGLQRLDFLDLTNCNLSGMPAYVAEMTWIKGLGLSYNKGLNDSHLKEMLSKFSELEELGMDGCDLREWPIDSCQNTMLEDLSLAGNSLDTVPEWIHCYRRLSDLDLSNNEIKTVPEVLWRLPAIHRIVLDTNRIVTLPISKKIPTPYLDVFLRENPLDTIALKKFEELMYREGVTVHR